MIRAAPTDSNGTSITVMALSRPRALARPGLSLRSWPSKPAASRNGLDGAQRYRPRHDRRAADRQQNPSVPEGKPGPMRQVLPYATSGWSRAKPHRGPEQPEGISISFTRR